MNNRKNGAHGRLVLDELMRVIPNRRGSSGVFTALSCKTVPILILPQGTLLFKEYKMQNVMLGLWAPPPHIVCASGKPDIPRLLTL